MPQIASGSNATFTVPANYVIDVQCPGGWIQLEYPVGTKIFEGNVAANRTFGPFAAGSAKLTSVKGDIYYETDPSPSANVPFDPSNVDIRGGTIANQSAVAVAHASQLLRRPMKVSVLTNSFGAQVGNWFGEMCAASGGLFSYDYNGGVSGNTSAQMLARVNDIPTTSQVCFVLEGTNDASTPLTGPQHAANMLAICQALQARGILPILCLPPPRNSLGVTLPTYRIAEYQLARKYGFLVVDPFGSYFDPTSSLGNWTAGADNGDGIHPSQTTYRDAGRAIIDQLRGTVQRNLIQPKGNLWPGMVTNNLHQTSTGGLAAQWSKQGTGVATIAAGAGDGILGNWQTFTATTATGTNGLITGLTLPAGAQDSDEYLVNVAMKVNVSSGTPGIYLFVRWRNAVAAGLRDDFFLYNSTIGSFPAKYWQQVLTPPAGAFDGQLWAHFAGGSAYTADLSVGEVVVVNLTRTAGF